MVSVGRCYSVVACVVRRGPTDNSVTKVDTPVPHLSRVDLNYAQQRLFHGEDALGEDRDLIWMPYVTWCRSFTRWFVDGSVGGRFGSPEGKIFDYRVGYRNKKTEYRLVRTWCVYFES